MATVLVALPDLAAALIEVLGGMTVLLKVRRFVSGKSTSVTREGLFVDYNVNGIFMASGW